MDESGTDAQSDIVVLAGLIGPAAAWIPLDQAWLTALTDVGMPFYHATEVEGQRPKGVFRRLGKKKARGLTDRLTAIVDGQDEIFGFGAFVDASDWFAATDLIRPLL